MRKFLVLVFLLFGASASASEFKLIGRAALFSNDYLGDGDDRWRSGSYSRSTFFGPAWDGEMPSGGVFELRFRGELIAPTEPYKPPTIGERPFVGVAAVGVARHGRTGGLDLRLGADAVFIGPQSGVSSFVTEAHDILGFRASRSTSGELGNDLLPTATFEASRLIAGSARRPFQLRPFVEAQAGAETYARMGVDVLFGQGVAGDLLARDVVTGQLMTVVSMQELAGFTPMIGMDVARVVDSYFLPESSGLKLENWRMRVRGGVRSMGRTRDVFMGLTWLSPEYKGQPSGQVLGSLSIDHHF